MGAKISKKIKFAILAVVLIVTALVLVWFLRQYPIPVLEPKGVIGQKERHLMAIAIIMSIVVVVPVFAITIFIAWKYREGNHKAKYNPDYDHSNILEFTWWAIPIIIIGILSVVAWNSAHELDPFKALAATNPNSKTLTVQVVSLDWKWLFIYPEQNIATVNFAEIPLNTPVDFHVTSDSVMNSFWVPSLGGQIYSMPGMSTQLNLMTSVPGNYNGSSANISGQGFAGMTFVIKATKANDFNKWVQTVKKAPNSLSSSTYGMLAMPSQYNPVAYYSSAENGLYDGIVMKYMMPASEMPSMTAASPTQPMSKMKMQGMEM